jgi:hypothetical protein
LECQGCNWSSERFAQSWKGSTERLLGSRPKNLARRGQLPACWRQLPPAPHQNHYSLTHPAPSPNPFQQRPPCSPRPVILPLDLDKPRARNLRGQIPPGLDPHRPVAGVVQDQRLGRDF